MSTTLRTAASVGGSAAIIGASLLFDGSVAQAAPFDGTDPIATGCSNTARVARQADLVNGVTGAHHGTVQLYYSSACRTVWAKVITDEPGCQPGIDFCGDAVVHRLSDGAELRCITPAGSSSCYTRQLNDANVTSLAAATADSGPYTYFGKTAAF